MGDLKRQSLGDMDAARNLPARETSSAPKDQTSTPGTPSFLKAMPNGSSGKPENGQREPVRGVPVSRLSDTFANFDLKRSPALRKAFARCKAVAEEKAWCALLVGGFGTGKTHLAIAALLAWHKKHGTGYFWKVPDFLTWIRHSVFDEKWSEEEIVAPYRTGATLVVFDDYGAENPTDWAYEQLYRVLDSRYDARLPTIITTNRPGGSIDGRILSRYREGLVICKGADVRATAGVD